MTALIDDLGIWVQMGMIQPMWDWLSFPVSFSTKTNIFRVNFFGNFSEINTFLYLRVVYANSGTENVGGKWIRIYPNQEKQLIELPINEIFLLENFAKTIQVRKASRWYGYKIPITDFLYQVSLEAFVPFPETINQVNNVPQLQGIINQELEQLKGELSLQITANINNAITQELEIIQNQYNVIMTMFSGGI